ncbi:MAG TPA: hypothetical protein VK703_03335, partial [Candidatus Acidoferrales bacterium]|nr:hypothetical protein [Candidatus Acidoferrales bacterium]
MKTLSSLGYDRRKVLMALGLLIGYGLSAAPHAFGAQKQKSSPKHYAGRVQTGLDVLEAEK